MSRNCEFSSGSRCALKAGHTGDHIPLSVTYRADPVGVVSERLFSIILAFIGMWAIWTGLGILQDRIEFNREAVLGEFTVQSARISSSTWAGDCLAGGREVTTTERIQFRVNLSVEGCAQLIGKSLSVSYDTSDPSNYIVGLKKSYFGKPAIYMAIGLLLAGIGLIGLANPEGIFSRTVEISTLISLGVTLAFVSWIAIQNVLNTTKFNADAVTAVMHSNVVEYDFVYDYYGSENYCIRYISGSNPPIKILNDTGKKSLFTSGDKKLSCQDRSISVSYDPNDPRDFVTTDSKSLIWPVINVIITLIGAVIAIVTTGYSILVGRVFEGTFDGESLPQNSVTQDKS